MLAGLAIFFDTYSIPYKIIRPGDFAGIDFTREFDLVIFPDTEKTILMEGEYKDETILPDYPLEYCKGIGKEGMVRLMTFLDAGL